MFTRNVLSAVSLVAFLATVLVVAAPSAAGTLIALNDLNSQVRFDTDQGVVGWDVDGVNHLFMQGFWYRFDNMTLTKPLINLGYVNHVVSDTNLNDGDDTLNIIYGNAGFSVGLMYSLAGGEGGSHTSALQEIITFHNPTAQAVHLKFFQYCDFDINGTYADDIVKVTNTNAVRQWDASAMVAETVVTPRPESTEVATYAATLQKLNNTGQNLDGSTGPLGPTDATWAFQWDLTVPANGTLQISKIKAVTPEPATLSLLALGGLGMLFRRRK